MDASPEHELRSTLLVGEGAPIERLSIREFKYLTPEGPYANNYELLSSKIATAVGERALNTLRSIYDELPFELPWQSYGEFNKYRSAHSIETQTITKLKSHLIAKKIITGDITSLAMNETTEDVLPRGMVNGFQRINNASRRDPKIDGHDEYYAVIGQLHLGGRSMASVACGVCVSPYMKVYSTYEPSGRLEFRTQVTPFNVKDREDLSMWQESIDAARRREAYAKTHPLNGGLVNPS